MRHGWWGAASLVLVAVCAGCTGAAGADGEPCTVQTDADGARIACPDGTEAFVPNGVDASTEGTEGPAGSSCTVEQTDDGAVVTCDDGTSAALVLPAGAGGVDGTSCTVEQTDDGATITCGDGTTAEIANGTDGAAGAAGTSPGADGSRIQQILITGEDGSTQFVSWYDTLLGVPCTWVILAPQEEGLFRCLPMGEQPIVFYFYYGAPFGQLAGSAWLDPECSEFVAVANYPTNGYGLTGNSDAGNPGFCRLGSEVAATTVYRVEDGECAPVFLSGYTVYECSEVPLSDFAAATLVVPE